MKYFNSFVLQIQYEENAEKPLLIKSGANNLFKSLNVQN